MKNATQHRPTVNTNVKCIYELATAFVQYSNVPVKQTVQNSVFQRQITIRHIFRCMYVPYFITLISFLCIKLASKHQPFLFPVMILLFFWSCRDKLRERERQKEGGGLDVLPQRRTGEKIHESCCFRISFRMFQRSGVCACVVV